MVESRGENNLFYDVILFTDMNARFWHVRSLGAYKVATELRKNGFSVKVIDFFKRWLESPREFHDLLKKFIGPNTLFIGFSGTFFSIIQPDHNKSKFDYKDYQNELNPWPVDSEKINLHFKYIKKQYPHIKLVYGGVTQDYQVAQCAPTVDYVVRGLADNTAIELAKSLKHHTPLKYKPSGPGARILDHDVTASGFDFANSSTVFCKDDDLWFGEIMPFESSRGCLFRCAFCDYPLVGRKKSDPKYHKNVDVIAAEWKSNFEDHGISTYMMVDDTFNETTEKIEDLLRARDLSGVDIKFSAYIRADLVNRFPEQIKLLNNLGLETAFFGIESLYQPSAHCIGKSSNPNKIKETLYQLKSDWTGNPLLIQGSFIIGLPEDNPDTLATWLPWVDSHDCPIDMVQLNVLSINDNSEISRNPEKFGYTVIQNPFNKKWKNRYWDQPAVHEFVTAHMTTYWNSGRLRVAGWDYMGLVNIGFDHEYLRKTTLNQLVPEQVQLKNTNLWNVYKSKVLQQAL